MTTPVKFELAKLLEQKGFNEPCQYYYDTTSCVKLYPPQRTNDISKDMYPNFIVGVPTIAEVCMWLYRKYNIWIVILPELLNGVHIRYYPSVFEQGVGEDIESYHNTPEQAYEYAIEYVLNNMI